MQDALEPQVGRPEIVGPLRHAVRLVDTRELEGRDGLGESDETVRHQPLGRYKEDMDARLLEPLDNCQLLGVCLRGVERGACDPCRQVLQLVADKGQQRRYY